MVMIGKYFLRNMFTISGISYKIISDKQVFRSNFKVLAASHYHTKVPRDEGEKMSYDIPSYITALLLINISLILLMFFFQRKPYRRSGNGCSQYETMINELKKTVESQKYHVDSVTELYNKALENCNSKTLLLADLTHDLKMPLSIILGIVQIMEKEQKSLFSEQGFNKASKYLGQIKSNCSRMLYLINNILDFAHIESNHTSINLSSCDIVQITYDTLQSTSPMAVQKGLSYDFNSSDKEIITDIDIIKYERALLNLLSNAIKFSREGGKISVSISKSKEKIYVSVTDDGPGIPREMHDKIFERYKYARNSLTRGAEGSGLGLAIAKHFVELHNGSIRLISSEGKGSTFIIELPLKSSTSKPAAHIPALR